MFVLLVCYLGLALHFTLSSRPNIVLFLVDDLGWNDVGYHGAEFSAPNIDELQKMSLRLDRYYVQSSCSPSRAALLTGRYPHRMGLAHTVVTNGFDIGVPPSYRTLADELRSADYATHMCGKWDIGMSRWSQTPTYRGFDHFLGYYNAFQDPYTHRSNATPGILGTSALPVAGIDLRDGTTAMRIEPGVFGSDLFTDCAVDSIKQGSHSQGDRPLFLYLSHQAVHTPHNMPAKYWEQCRHVEPKSRRGLCAMVKVIDQSLRHVTQALKAAGQWENTLFLFMTDNGGQTDSGSSNWPLRGGKLTVYEGGVRGIAFLHGPGLGVRAGSTDMLIHTVDWLPTLVTGVARQPLSTNITPHDGYNMWESLRAGGRHVRKEVLLQYDPPFHGLHGWYESSWPGQAAFIHGSWKLISGSGTCGVIPSGSITTETCNDGWFMANGTSQPPPADIGFHQLYNVKLDPEERYDLAKLFPFVVERLWQRIGRLYAHPRTAQVKPVFDELSDPARYGGYWSPWLGV